MALLEAGDFLRIPWLGNDARDEGILLVGGTKAVVHDPKHHELYCTRTSILPPTLLTPPDHLFLDSALNLGPLISRWEINKFENCCYKSVRILDFLKLLLQQVLNCQVPSATC